MLFRALLGLSLFALAPSFAWATPVQPSPDVSLFDRVSHRYAAISAGVSFYYYTQEDRIQLINEVFNAIDANYSLLPIKEYRFGLNLENMRKEAVNAEAAIADTPNEADEALSNLAFLDRAKKIIAVFQDTHFSIDSHDDLLPVVIPISIAKVEKKYVVSSYVEKLMGYLASSDPTFSSVELGDEITSIDGQTPDQAEKELEPYISASSQAFREIEALQSLTFRNFALPAKNTVMIGIRKSDGTELMLKFPWLVRQPSRGDENAVFLQRQYTKYDQLRMTWDESKKKWSSASIPFKNGDYASSLPALINENNYVDASNAGPALKTGYLLRNGKAYGVLQISTFMTTTMLNLNAGLSAQPVGFLDTIQAFMKELSANSVPLLVDIRSNGGGNGDYPAAVVSMMAEEGKVYPGPTAAFRVTRDSLEVLGDIASPQTVAEAVIGITQDNLKKLFADAIASGNQYTQTYSNVDIKADRGAGYNQKIVVMVGPNCISACDMITAIFKATGRATVIGQPSNGTGAGFFGDRTMPWSDSYRVFSARIPNFIFGKPAAKAGLYTIDDPNEDLNLENRPSVPDVAYEPTMDDVFNKSAGWIAKALDQLDVVSVAGKAVDQAMANSSVLPNKI